ncbi:hypothetical protein LAZ67_8001473, partial [Cordylochernes scorpioides]
MEEQTEQSNDATGLSVPQQETTFEEEETSPPQGTSADPLTQIADALYKLLVARSPREIDVSPYDGTFEAQSFFDNFDAQADRAKLTYTDRLRKLPCYLQGKPLQYFRNLRLDRLFYIDVRQTLIDLFPTATEASFSRFLAIKLTPQMPLEDYYQNKTVMGMKLNLPADILIDSLTEGLPVADQRLIATVQPNTIKEWFDLVSRIRRTQCATSAVYQRQVDKAPHPTYHNPPPRHNNQRSSRVTYQVAPPPSPCKYCNAMHWHSQCEQRFQRDRTSQVYSARPRTTTVPKSGTRPIVQSRSPVPQVQAASRDDSTSPASSSTTRNLDTISAIKPPSNQKTLQSFLGAVNVYNKFIPDYARLRAPLNKLLKKDVKWNWDPDCQQAFTTLKESLTSKPVLHLYQVGLPCRLYCDASTQGIAGILKQVHPDGQVHPVQYFSRALRAHERNYTVSELECLAIVESVDKFRIYLTGIKFTIYTDHQALQWLKTIKNPSGRLFRWSLRLSTYNYEIHYLKGSQQYEADLLSRNPFVGFVSADIIKQHQPTASPFNIDTNGLHTITRKGVIKIIIPETLQHTLMNKVHQEYNHPGISQMTRIITAQYYWKGISKSIEKFVKSCHTCQIIKRPKGKPYGALGQIPPPQQPFDLISIDTIAGFSKYGHSKTYLHVIVDHLTRYAWTFPSKSTSTLTYIQTHTHADRAATQVLAPPFSPLASGRTSRKNLKFILAESPQSAVQVPERPSVQSQPGDKISPKERIEKNSSKEFSMKFQRNADPPAREAHASPAAARDDVTAPLIAASCSASTANPAPLIWGDSELAEMDDNDAFTVVRTKKRRRDSPVLPAMAAQSNSAGTSRRQRPSTGRMPQVQEIRTTRAHVMEARARQASCTEEQCCFLEFCPEYQTYQYMKALEKVVGSTGNIVQFTKVNGQYLVGLANRSLVERLVREGLEIEGTLLKTFPFRRTSIRVTIGNLPFFVGDASVMDALSRYGRITSIAPKQLRVGEFNFTDGRREAFILLHDGITVEMLPSRFELRIKGEPWPAFLTHGVKCSKCRGQGHRRANCPQLHGRPTTARRASPPLSTGLPPSTAPGLPGPSPAAPTPPAPTSPAVRLSGAQPDARVASPPSTAPRPSTPAPPASSVPVAAPVPPSVAPAPVDPAGPRSAATEPTPPARPDFIAPCGPLPAQGTLGPATHTADVDMTTTEEPSAPSPAAVSTPPLPAPQPAGPTPSAPHKEDPTPAMTPPSPPPTPMEEDLPPNSGDCIDRILTEIISSKIDVGPLVDDETSWTDAIDAILHSHSRAPFLARLSPILKKNYAVFFEAAIERARDSHPRILSGLSELRRALAPKTRQDNKLFSIVKTYIQTLKTVLQQGSPKRLLSDRAPAFTSEKFRKFLITHGIQPLLTTSNNPQANGLIERLNATITGKLRLAYLENPKASWTQLVKRVTQTYNNTPHSVTSFPPTYLMFNVIPPDLRTHLDPYPEINIAREIANSRTQNKHKKDKETFDKQHRTPHFEVNDLVLVKNYRHPDTGKLAPYFTGPYKIIEIISPNVVRIDRPNQPLNRDSDTIHVNKLKYYTENVLYITPPQTRFAQNPQRLSQDVYFSEFNHLTPDIFETQLVRIIPPTSSQPFLHLNPRSVEVFLKIHSKLVRCKLHVVKNFSYPLLIGLDVARKIGLIIDTKVKAVYVKINECFYISPETHLPSVQQKELNQLLKENQALFSQHETDIGRIAVQHKIHTIEHTPISCRPYRRPLAEYDEIKRQVEELSKKGLIRESQSPWAFPVVLVSKKDGSQRMCIDYRKLNAITIDDKQPLPYIQDMFDRLHNAKYFTTLDIAWGYWHVEIHPDSVEKTALITNDGHYEFLVMPFGLKNAPSTFQRIIQHIIGNLLWNGVCIYQDDILIYSSTFKDHIELMKKIFDKLKENNIKLKLKKCSFAKQEIRYLGHIIGHNKIKPDPEKTKAINEFPQPKTVKQVRQFLGLAGYYRKFIPKFSEIADPLTSLIRINKLFKWTTEVNKSFQELKSHLFTDPVLSTYDPSLPCKLYTHASKLGIGAILAQIGNDNQEHVISYYSGKLLPHQQNYSAFELECFAVVQSVEYFEVYLENNTFEVITDHSALEWLFNVKKPKAKYLRWIIELSTKSMKIVHRSGSKQTHVDALSRSPVCLGLGSDPVPGGEPSHLRGHRGRSRRAAGSYHHPGHRRGHEASIQRHVKCMDVNLQECEPNKYVGNIRCDKCNNVVPEGVKDQYIHYRYRQ